MQKSLLFLLVLIMGTATLHAQDADATSDTEKKISKPSRDFVMLQFTYESWLNTPDSINITGFGRGFNGYLCYDFPIKNSNFSFAAGIGIGTSNIYFKDQEVVFNDTTAQVQFIPERTDYGKYKLTTAYLEAPFELRFYGNQENRNRGFKAALGLRVGSLVGAHTKGKRTVNGARVVEKVNSKRYLDTWRFAGTVRLGWGNFTLLGTCNLNSLFKAGQGPEFTPYSIGLCISGL